MALQFDMPIDSDDERSDEEAAEPTAEPQPETAKKREIEDEDDQVIQIRLVF